MREKEKGGIGDSMSDSYSPEGLRIVGNSRQLRQRLSSEGPWPKGHRESQKENRSKDLRNLRVSGVRSLRPTLLSPLKMQAHWADPLGNQEAD